MKKILSVSLLILCITFVFVLIGMAYNEKYKKYLETYETLNSNEFVRFKEYTTTKDGHWLIKVDGTTYKANEFYTSNSFDKGYYLVLEKRDKMNIVKYIVFNLGTLNEYYKVKVMVSL